MNKRSSVLVALALAALSPAVMPPIAHAGALASVDTPTPPNPPVAVDATRTAGPSPAIDAQPTPRRGRFSVKRLIVNTLVGAAAGSLASYGVYEALCSGNDCLGPAL